MSHFATAAAAAGIEYPALIESITEHAARRFDVSRLVSQAS